MNQHLLMNAALKFFMGLLLMGVLLFLPAGSFCYWNGWLLMGLLSLPVMILGLYLWNHAPELLRKRLRAKEQDPTQKRVVGLSAGMLSAGFILAALDFRFTWSDVPLWLLICACCTFLLAYGLYAEVMRENAYLSRTVEIQPHQAVVDTGLYSIVRHPMYAASILLFLSMPLILGSFASLLCFLLYPGLIIVRIRNEEALLAQELDGYRDYQQRVRYRLVPFLW